MKDKKKITNWVQVPCPPYWVKAESARYELEIITPTNRFTDSVRYTFRGNRNARKHTRKIRTQMFKYALSERFASPPDGLSHNITINSSGLMKVPGYIRASSDSYIYGYMLYLDGQPVCFEKHSSEIGYHFDYWLFDTLLKDGFVLFCRDYKGESLKKFYMSRFFRFYEFPTKDAEGFDYYKQKRLEKSPQYWKATVVRESLLDYYGSYTTRSIVDYQKWESQMKREAVAESCRRTRGSSRECRRQLRLMGFVA